VWVACTDCVSRHVVLAITGASNNARVASILVDLAMLIPMIPREKKGEHATRRRSGLIKFMKGYAMTHCRQLDKFLQAHQQNRCTRLETKRQLWPSTWVPFFICQLAGKARISGTEGCRKEKVPRT
jgi:hypothetical protein